MYLAVGLVVGSALTIAVQAVASSTSGFVPYPSGGRDDGSSCAVYVATSDSDGGFSTQIVYANQTNLDGVPQPVTATQGPAERLNAQLNGTVTAISDDDVWYNPGDTPDRSDFAGLIVGTHLVGVSWGKIYGYSLSSSASGWSGFRALIDTAPWRRQDNIFAPRYLYGLNKNGRIYRYKVGYPLPNQVPYGDGSVPGFSHVKGITLVAAQPGYDTLLANLDTGALIEITIPRTTTITAHTTTIRSSGWSSFDHLVASPCGTGSVIAGINHATGHAYVYQLTHLAGTSTQITKYGLSPLPVTQDLVTSWDDAHNQRSIPDGA